MKSMVFSENFMIAIDIMSFLNTNYQIFGKVFFKILNYKSTKFNNLKQVKNNDSDEVHLLI